MKKAIKDILKEEIPRSLYGSGHSHMVGHFRILSLLVRDFHDLPGRDTCPQEESFVSFVSCYCWTCHNSS